MKLGVVGNTIVALAITIASIVVGNLFNHIIGGAIVGCCLAIVYIMVIAIVKMANAKETK